LELSSSEAVKTLVAAGYCGVDKSLATKNMKH